jgi:hypothetical protein
MGRRRAEAEAMQKRIGELADTQDRLKEEKYQLVADLRLTEVEAKVARREVTNLVQQLSVAGEEKVRLMQTASVLATNVTTLATNVTTLAEQSTAMREQIERQARLSANTVFADFQTNRVRTDMTGKTRGGLGQEVVRRKEGGTVLVRLNGRVYAVVHLETTPLRLWPPDAPWSAFQAGLERGGQRVACSEFALLRRDPRVALLPVSDAQAAQLGARVYEPATDPAQFADAVVVGGEELYYGESAFRLVGDLPGYVSMERSTFRRMMGEFAPRRGDLAFTKTGQLLGILVNGDHCLLLDRLETLPPFRTGEGTDAAAHASIVGMAQAVLERQPAALR